MARPQVVGPLFMRLTREANRYVLSGAHGEEVSFPSVAEPLRAGAELTNLTASMELRREADRYRVRHWHIGGHVSLFDFDAKLEGTMALAAISDLSGHRVRMEYDTRGRPARLVQEPEQRVVEMTYDAKNLLNAIFFVGDSGRKLMVRYEYDAKRRLIGASTRSATGRVTSTTRPAADRRDPPDGVALPLRVRPGWPLYSYHGRRRLRRAAGWST